MAVISSYYAQVGLTFDRKALRSAQAYFRSVERTLANFQRRVARGKTTTISLRATVDRSQLQRQLQVAASRLSNTVVIPLKRFQIDRNSLRRSIQTAMGANVNQAGSARIGVRIAQSSLSHMRDQIRAALEGTVIRPRVSPRVTPTGGRNVGGASGSGGTHLDPRNTRRMSPWHNPMMVGGGAGAFMRYGFYSLPFVGGVVGLNAYSNLAQEYRAQETGLSFAAKMSTDAEKQNVGFHRDYLHSVGERTGLKESLLSRDYHQLLAGSAGTKMEPHLQEGFLGLSQYGSILGLSDDSMKLVLRGITQMVLIKTP